MLNYLSDETDTKLDDMIRMYRQIKSESMLYRTVRSFQSDIPVNIYMILRYADDYQVLTDSTLHIDSDGYYHVCALTEANDLVCEKVFGKYTRSDPIAFHKTIMLLGNNGTVYYCPDIQIDQQSDQQITDTKIVNTDITDTKIVNTEITDTKIVNTEITDTKIVNTEITDTEIADTDPINALTYVRKALLSRYNGVYRKHRNFISLSNLSTTYRRSIEYWRDKFSASYDYGRLHGFGYVICQDNDRDNMRIACDNGLVPTVKYYMDRFGDSLTDLCMKCYIAGLTKLNVVKYFHDYLIDSGRAGSGQISLDRINELKICVESWNKFGIARWFHPCFQNNCKNNRYDIVTWLLYNVENASYFLQNNFLQNEYDSVPSMSDKIVCRIVGYMRHILGYDNDHVISYFHDMNKQCATNYLSLICQTTDCLNESLPSDLTNIVMSYT